MKILYINKHENSGGASKIASSLFLNFWNYDPYCRFLVNIKESNNPNIFEISEFGNKNTGIATIFWFLSKKLQNINKNFLFKRKLQSILWGLSHPKNLKNRIQGVEDFYFPNNTKFIKKIINNFDIVHLHNLHDNYFDLQFLSELSHEKPTLITLHDEWLYTGHCGASINCDKWITGCGNCPDLKIYPPIRKDATNYNWIRKSEIYKKSKLFICSPSKWLLDRAKKSTLSPAIVSSKVIPNGVDQSIFSPIDKINARKNLGVDPSNRILLFVGNKTKSNPFKDYETLELAARIIQREKPDLNFIFYCIGEEEEDLKIDNLTIKFIPFVSDEKLLARYYQASDIYIHAAKSDNFPTTILESLSCGTPVIATNVGGINEQIIDNQNGFLVPPKKPEIMAEKIIYLLENDNLLNEFSLSAITHSRNNYSKDMMISKYNLFYKEIISMWSQKNNNG